MSARAGRLYDEDGIDGPFEANLRTAMREDARRPLRALAPEPDVEIREVVCPLCGGCCEIEGTINLRWHQDSERRPCSCNDGKVTVHLAVIDGDLRCWCPTLGLLAIVDEAELASGNWSNHRPANRLSVHDRWLLSELGADL